MSAYRFWTLTCDECGEISDAGMSMTVTEARRFARHEGWTVKNRTVDTCGVCNGTHERLGDVGTMTRIPEPTDSTKEAHRG